jgi:hypothetical protein
VDKPKYIPPRKNDLKPAEPRTFNKPTLQNAPPQGSVNNQTNTADDSADDNTDNQINTAENNDDNTSNQTRPGTNLRLPATVNSVVK